MGLRIKTNVQSLIAQRRLGESTKAASESYEKLASGQRVNRAADDAAGLAVSENIRAKTRALDVSKRNANDAISYIQVAEGGLNETTSIIVRMRELAAQAASDTIGNRERSFLNEEFQQLKMEAQRIVDGTEFNGSRVLQVEKQKPMQIFVGASYRGKIDGEEQEFDLATDPDLITIDLQSLEGLQEALFAVTKNEDLRIVPDSDEGGAADLGGDDNTPALFGIMDDALNKIAEYRATLGSIQSRMNSAITNIDISNENLQAAQSRIRDVDYASETAKLTTNRILQQAGASVLTQANTSSEFALQLLRGGM